MEKDTEHLFLAATAGLDMALQAFEDILLKANNDTLKKIIERYKNGHQSIYEDILKILDKENIKPKSSPFIAKSISHIRTILMMKKQNQEQGIAEILIDGCDMGIKNLSMDLNKYPTASKEAKHLVKKIIDLEINLEEEMRLFL